MSFFDNISDWLKYRFKKRIYFIARNIGDPEYYVRCTEKQLEDIEKKNGKYLVVNHVFPLDTQETRIIFEDGYVESRRRK